MTAAQPSARRGRPRGSEAPQVLSIARAMFVAHGFRGTTMEAVAEQAHVSKQSIYRDYSSKAALYAAVVRDWVDRGYEAMRPHTTTLAQTADVGQGLLTLALVVQAGLLSPPVLQMRTLVSAEAHRFPDVARDYVARSWTRNIAMLADALAALDGRGMLRVDDPQLAAEQLTWLVVGAPLNRLTLQGGSRPSPAGELEKLASEGVTTFLSRYLA